MQRRTFLAGVVGTILGGSVRPAPQEAMPTGTVLVCDGDAWEPDEYSRLLLAVTGPDGRRAEQWAILPNPAAPLGGMVYRHVTPPDHTENLARRVQAELRAALQAMAA